MYPTHRSHYIATTFSNHSNLFSVQNNVTFQSNFCKKQCYFSTHFLYKTMLLFNLFSVQNNVTFQPILNTEQCYFSPFSVQLYKIILLLTHFTYTWNTITIIHFFDLSIQTLLLLYEYF